MTQPKSSKPNELHDLGYKIFLDRYAQKDMTRETLAVGDIVIVVMNAKTGQREIGKVTALDLPKVTIKLNDGEIVERDIENVDKPLETDPGQMMDRVAKGIAAIEKTKKLQKEWTKNFRWLLEGWKFVPGGRILAAAGTNQELTFYNCMPPEQEILTEDGYIPIADVRIGDYVVTHRNRLRKVLHKFERDTEESLYIIKPKKVGYDDLRVTGDHKIYAIRSEWVNSHRSRDGLRLKEEPQWIPAKELKLGDYVAVAYNGEYRDIQSIQISDYIGFDAMIEDETEFAEGAIVSAHSAYEVSNGQLIKATTHANGKIITGKRPLPLNNELVLDEDLCYLFGRWLGDGCITHRTGTDIPSGIKIVFSLEELPDAQEIADIIEAKLGITADIKLSSTKRWYDLWLNSMPVGEFFKAFLGYYSHSKFISQTLMYLPDHLTLALLRGLFKADGYTSGKYIGMLLSNRALMIQVHQLLLRLGYFFSITENTHKNSRVPAYRVSATGSEADNLFEKFFGTTPTKRGYNLKACIEYDNLRWVRIEQIAIEDYSGIVLDIEVEEDHSFVSAGVVVSNCYVVPSPQDSRGGIMTTLTQMTEIMSRGGGVGMNLSTLRPRQAYVKGVNGRSSGSVSWGGLYSFVTGLIEQGGSRRGALMIILNDWHPDIFDFINSKRQAGQITNANISVGVSDKLMEAIEKDADWDLRFPDTSDPDYDELWDGDLDTWIAAGRKTILYKTVKAREIWDAIIESAWASAEPGVWFRERSNKLSNSWYFNPLIATNPCGEQSLGAWSVCNLGAINLANFYDEKNNDVNWQNLDKAVRIATRFLDNVIDTTPYFFDENYDMQKSERRVGLGTMGVAELMISCSIRYGSDESVDFIDKVYKAIAVAAYETSSELAKEKGAFPKFDAEKYLESGYMQQIPDNVRDKILEDGIRNVTLLTQAPTGCVAPDTLISAADGLMSIVEMGNPDGSQWQIMPREVHTDTGIRKASHFYINGRQAVRTIKTKRGFTITATHNHRLRVIDKNGDYVWRRMDEFQIEDQVVLKRNTLSNDTLVRLEPVEKAANSKSDLPEIMTPEFAELLGLYMGDGYTKKRGGLHIVVGQEDPDLLEYVKNLMQEVWGERHIGVEERIGCWIANLTGYYIPRFFKANDLSKPSGNEGQGAAGAFIPSKVLQAGRECVAAFLSGLFEADGCVHRGTITLVSTSKQLIQQVQVALLGLGIVATIRQMPEQENRYGKRPLYELRILNRREAQRFVEIVGFISQRKREKAANLGTISDRGDNIAIEPLLREFYAQSQGLPNVVRQTIIGRVSNGALTQQFAKECVAEYPMLAESRLAQLLDLDIYVDAVVEISDGVCDTYDISVPDNHTYIANGFVSHNTTGTMVNTSTGIEPFFSWVYYRKSRLGLHEEQSPIVAKYFAEHPDETELPEYFVTAMDLAPEEHVKVQGAFQKWIDSAISKTSNVPNEYTVEQVSELYKLMYELGCKGGTIYRDGSRSEQVLMLKGDDRAESEMEEVKGKKDTVAEKTEQVTTPHRVYPRPNVLNGTTVRFNTPFGKSYITMNSDANHNPFEIFITVGKAGSDIQADAEALGRMISLQLRTTAPQNRYAMLSLIVEQLQDIGGARPVGFGPNRILSLPDAVGRALQTHYFEYEQPKQLGLPMNGDNHAPEKVEKPEEPKQINGYAGADMCPDCGTISLIRAEGCRKCLTCGYSEC